MTTLCPMCKKALSAAEIAGGFCDAGHAGSSDIAGQLAKQVTTTLCGHDRDTLEWALDACEEPTDRWLTIVAPFGDDNEVGRCAIAATDPAKLAELMAEELVRRGFHVYDDDPGDDFALPYADIFDRNGGVCVLVALTWEQIRDGAAEYQLSPHQARAALLRLMQLPEGAAAQDVLKALEVAS